ncbi:zinc-binding dehydrogenase [Nonomuraea endophytica]|uniref:NADPH:quinone reductase-like Zn-dependent oxidoreductase n=1 Tax=Nonomuraea endophytica TaxID=714136 RepID=A0A7W8A9K5_9ACTN|nr:zinc-binding dehydrogenase [Nonomuraea endophytica]MBB5081559.1 NADPH:quinone reductase-like Zn-dependent oxidoreductase [Nonomuraea endophytica]
MNIVEVTRFGGPEVLRVRQSSPVTAGPEEVVIEVRAADVLSIEVQLRTGWGREWFGTRPPYVPGTAVAGVVRSAPEAGSWEGRRVAALLPGGGYAEQVAAPLSALVEVPENVSLISAAALLQVGPAALSLLDAAELKPGARVLVTGAGGALGLVLVELAARAGAHVVGAARGPAKRARALSLGASSVVDYPDLASGDLEFDAVFDGVGGQVGADAFALTAPGGVFFGYGVLSGEFAAVGPDEAERRGVRLVGIEQVQFTPEALHRLAERTLTAGITPTIGLAVPLDQAHRAHAALEARDVVGKAVLVTHGRAVRYSEHGGAEVLRVDEVPIPVPGPGQVRVAVRAAGVNAVDWKIRGGAFGIPLDGPTGTGLEFSGVIDAIGPDVDGADAGWLRVGQEVVGRHGGALADYVLAVPDDLVLKPDGLTHVEAAALPVAVETAARALGLLGLEEGRTLLIHAVAGGVGLAAAQVAIRAGLRVVGTASEPHHPYLKGLGVHPVTYGEGLEERIGEPVDLVLDASGRDVVAMSVRLTGDPDKVVSIADPGASSHGARFSSGSSNPIKLREIAGEIATTRLPIAAEFPLEEAADAHRLSEHGHFLGKIVVNVEANVSR